MKARQTQSGLPPAVTRWINSVFLNTNKVVTRKLSEIPTVHEPSLDMSFVESLSRVPVPPPIAGWRVQIQTHFLGGRALFMNWEIADIGLLVFIRQGGRLVRSKLALLQSKRLYPDEIKQLPDDRLRYEIGFATLSQSDEDYERALQPRAFHFTDKSRYGAFVIEDRQHNAVRDYQKDKGIPVYYMFYNPFSIPWTQTVPVSKAVLGRAPTVGIRVVPAETLFKKLAGLSAGQSPSFGDVASLAGEFGTKKNRAGWRLEYFMAELLVPCHEGYITTDRDDRALFEVFFRRSAPITAAIAIGVDAPDDVDLSLPEPKLRDG
jgi:hypothetical protein